VGDRWELRHSSLLIDGGKRLHDHRCPAPGSRRQKLQRTDFDVFLAGQWPDRAPALLLPRRPPFVVREIAPKASPSPDAAVSWQGLNLDFTGVVLDSGDPSRARFSGGIVRFNGAVFSGGTADFRDPDRWSQSPVLDWEGTPPAGVLLPADATLGRLTASALRRLVGRGAAGTHTARPGTWRCTATRRPAAGRCGTGPGRCLACNTTAVPVADGLGGSRGRAISVPLCSRGWEAQGVYPGATGFAGTFGMGGRAYA
jgi:hypothetical protein